MEEPKKRVDLDAASTDRKGIAGFFEFLIRRFRLASFLITLIPLYLLCILAMSIAAAPGIYFLSFMSGISSEWIPVIHYIALGFGVIGAYVIYGFSLIFVVPFFNFLLPMKLRPFRGNYYSITTVPWYFHNALTYIVRYTNISDPVMIDIGEMVTIGGSATIIAHYASQGFLIIDRVKIHKNATIGIKATVMGDVEIGEGAIVAPHEVVLPKSRIPAGRK